MQTIEYNNENNKNLRECIQALEECCGQLELVSYGLAPNPNGFCYEILEDNIDTNKVDNALESLNSEQEEVIKDIYLRGLL